MQGTGARETRYVQDTVTEETSDTNARRREDNLTKERVGDHVQTGCSSRGRNTREIVVRESWEVGGEHDKGIEELRESLGIGEHVVSLLRSSGDLVGAREQADTLGEVRHNLSRSRWGLLPVIYVFGPLNR